MASPALDAGASVTTSYDAVAYPTAIFAQATPDRLAVLATLHGLSAPPIHNARVLEIGGGDGMNLLALAAAYPGTRCLSFDLAASAVERGRAWAAAAGLGNVDIRQLDILDAAAGAIEGEWDYVIAHGVYAWVPGPVRAGVMRLIGRVLSPNGVAFVSYNAKPGGHLRIAMREMLLHQLEGIAGVRPRLAAAKSFLRAFAEQAPNEEPVAVAMRRLAAAMADRPDEVLHHDELGDVYAPQALSEVAAAAAAEGLLWLGDAGVGRLADGFAGAGDGAALRAAQNADYMDGRFFRQSLFVRAGAQPRRSFSPQAVAGLFAACRASKESETGYALDDARFDVGDAPLRDALDRLIARWPGRLPCGSLFDDDPHLEALFRLFDAGLIELHAGDAPFAPTAGERPLASPLVRMQLALGWPAVSTLDHRTLAMADPRARAFVTMLDGTRDMAKLADDWEASGHAAEVPLDAALQSTAAAALLQA